MSKNKFKSFDEDASKRRKTSLTEDEVKNEKPDFVENLEQERKGKLISIEDVNLFSSKLYNWLKSIAKYGNVDRTMIIVDRTELPHEKKINVLFYTFEYSYSINAKIPFSANEKGYLGCVVSARKPKVGEWWTRGSDLSDGNFNDNTWRNIVNDIVRYEIKNLQIDKTKQ